MTETVSPDMAGHGRFLGGLQHRPNGRKRLLARMLPAGTVPAHLLTGAFRGATRDRCTDRPPEAATSRPSMTRWAVRGGLSPHWTSGTGEKARRRHCCLGRPRTGGKPHNDGPRPEDPRYRRLVLRRVRQRPIARRAPARTPEAVLPGAVIVGTSDAEPVSSVVEEFTETRKNC
jgi:hypothetical protein